MPHNVQLRFQCPDCTRKLAPVDQLHHATQVVARKCGKCGTAWQLTVRPVLGRPDSGIQQLDIAEFHRISADPKPCGVSPQHQPR